MSNGIKCSISLRKALEGQQICVDGKVKAVGDSSERDPQNPCKVKLHRSERMPFVRRVRGSGNNSLR